MAGISDLGAMLRGMEPVLADEPYGITVQPAPVAGAFAIVAEDEGLTVIAGRVRGVQPSADLDELVWGPPR